MAGRGAGGQTCEQAGTGLLSRQSGRGPGVLEPGERLRVHGEPGTGPDLRQEASGDLPGGEPPFPAPAPAPSPGLSQRCPLPYHRWGCQPTPGWPGASAPGSLRPAGLSLLPWLLPRAARGPTPIAFCGSPGLGGSTGVCFLPLEFGVALGQWVLLSPAERGQLGHQTPVPDPRGILGARGPGRPWESSPGTPPPDPFLGKMDRDAPAAVRAARRWAPQCRQG